MIGIKSCPRCLRGDLFHGHDEYGSFKVCIQCGYMGYSGSLISHDLAKEEVSKRRGKR
jgi:hypothetical protein